MQNSDPSTEGAAPESPTEGASPATPTEAAATPAARSSEDEANGPVIELGLETVELSAADVEEPPAPSAIEHQEAPPLGNATVRAPEPEYHPSHWFLGITAFVVAAIDLGSKEWIKHALAGPELRRTSKHLEIIPGHLDFIFAQNPGGAWSFLRGLPDGLRRPFFLFVSSAAIVFIVSVYGRLEKRQWAMRWGLPLALGGAIGNLVDRIRYGWVCDFIDAYYKGGANEVHWPTFNPADIAIVVGVALMALDLLSLRRPHPPEDAPTPTTTTEPAGGPA
ncbi:MAG: signal peptidase II [Polyangiaceae bacterium]